MKLERDLEADADSHSLHMVELLVGEAIDEVNGEEAQDVVDAGSSFEVGRVLVHHMGSIGEDEELVVITVLHQEGVVLVGESSPHTLEAEVLATFQFAEERDAVEDLSVGMPGKGPKHIAVVEELHVAHEGERVLVFEEREVHMRHDEQGKCSVCESVEVKNTNFCPNCGTYMRESEG